jgi:uncharacterized membrane protein YhaH (DUF805 family)
MSNILQLLFSFDGRIRRTNYWLAGIGAGVVLTVIFMIIAMLLFGGASMAARTGPDGATAAGGGLSLGIIILYVVYFVALLWISLALQVKRWHDRDKSWLWIFINFIPLIGQIWSLVECGFLDGTPGPNRFGPSPKGIPGPATPAAATA